MVVTALEGHIKELWNSQSFDVSQTSANVLDLLHSANGATAVASIYLGDLPNIVVRMGNGNVVEMNLDMADPKSLDELDRLIEEARAGAAQVLNQ
jgi:hypothetical protein